MKQGAEDFVLLCYPANTPYSYDAHTPLSILCLGTFLELAGVRVEYFDERIDPRRRFLDLVAKKPRLVGFSVIGGYQITAASRLSRLVRGYSPESRILWGGIFPSALPEVVLAEDYVDVVVRGEGEETLLDLARTRGDLSGVRGISFRESGRVRRNEDRPPPDINDLPFVYQRKAAVMLERYLRRASIREAVGYETSRGCPFTCSFCYSPGFHRGVRVKPPETVARELKAMKGLGVDDIDIYDDTLFGGRQSEFPAYLEAIRRHMKGWIGNLRINMLDERLLRNLETSGCRWVYFGIESDDDATLKGVAKGMTSPEVEAGLMLMKGSPLRAVYSILYDLPFGDNDGGEKCLDLAKRLHREHPEAEIQVQSFVALPGTSLYAGAVKAGFAAPRRLEGWARHDHLRVENPWLEDPKRASRIYLSTFLAYRYRRHLSVLPFCLVAYPFHLLSRWRLSRRYFGFFVERALFECASFCAEIFSTAGWRAASALRR